MKEKLQELGFNKTQIEVYLCVLSRGRATPALISKDTGIKRPTVYAAAIELIKQGIVNEDIAGKSKYLTASTKDFEQLIAVKKQQLVQQELLATSLLPELKELARSAHSPIPKILYCSESELTDFLYKQSPVWNQSMIDTGETSWWGYNSADLIKQKFARDWIVDYWKTAPRKIDLHLFSPEHEEEKELKKKVNERRNIKNWSEENGATLWIVGDYIVMLVTNQKPQYAIQIKDRLMADSLRRTYRKLWQLIND